MGIFLGSLILTLSDVVKASSRLVDRFSPDAKKDRPPKWIAKHILEVSIKEGLFATYTLEMFNYIYFDNA